MKPLLSARRAAEALGYQPSADVPRDPQMRAFMAFAERNFPDAKRVIGRRVMFDPTVIASKVKTAGSVASEEPIDSSLSEAQRLAIAHARGQQIHGRRLRVVGGRS